MLWSKIVSQLTIFSQLFALLCPLVGLSLRDFFEKLHHSFSFLGNQTGLTRMSNQLIMGMNFAPCRRTHPRVNIPRGSISMDKLIVPRPRRKVVVVMGATGTGKSRLSIDLATMFNAEVINSDKMQVYKSLNIVTNKITEEECHGIPHHLLGIIDPEADFSARDFVHHASAAADAITHRGHLPIIAGGSNSFIKALVHDDIDFRSKYDCRFLWVDVSIPVLHSFVSRRVDQMVEAGLVEEAKEFFEPGGDYTRGISRAIGVPEMDEFFRKESAVDAATRAKLLESAIDRIKANTCTLACTQLQNILRLREHLEPRIDRLDATEAFLKRGDEAKEAWERLVARTSARIVAKFLYESRRDFVSAMPAQPTRTANAAAPVILPGPTTTTAVAAATR